MNIPLEILFISFLFYSFIGWFWESIVLNFIQEKTFVNRGFLLGPYCPIYGAACTCCYILLYQVTNPFVLFISSGIICSLAEYITSYVMEKLFHARWWDYSDIPFNLNGRICLPAACFFGICCTLICLYLEPWLIHLLVNVKAFYLQLMSYVVLAFFILDLVTTVITWQHFNQHLSTLHARLKDETNDKLQELAERFADTEFVRSIEKNKVQVNLDDLEVIMKKNELRFMKAFPRLKMNDYDLFSKIQLDQHLKNVTKKKRDKKKM